MPLDPNLFTPEEIERLNQISPAPAEPAELPAEAEGIPTFEEFQESIRAKNLGVEKPIEAPIFQAEQPKELSAFEKFQQEGEGLAAGEAEIEQIKENLRAKNLGIEIPEELVSGSPEFKEVIAGVSEEGPAPTIGGALLETATQVPKDIFEAAKNVPASAGRLVKNIVTAIASPIDTAKSLGNLALGLVEKIIPGEQDSEVFADALINDYKERFGTTEGFREAFIEDPVGILADTAGLLIGGGAAIKGAGAVSKLQKLVKAGEVVGRVGRGLEPLAAVTRGVGAVKRGIGGKVAEKLKESAQAGLERVLAPTKEKFKIKTKKILPKLAEEKPIALTREGFREKIQAKTKKFGEKIDEFVEKEGVQGTTKIKTLTTQLKDIKEEFIVKGVNVEPKTTKVIDGIVDQLEEFGDIIPNEDLLNLRRVWDKTINKKGGFDILKSSELADELNFKKIVTNSIRSELAKASPKLAALNKKFSFYKGIDDILRKTSRRKTGQGKGLVKGVALVAGLASGTGVFGKLAAGLGFSQLIGALESTAWRTLTSAAKQSIADALISGDKTRFTKIIEKTIPQRILLQQEEKTK